MVFNINNRKIEKYQSCLFFLIFFKLPAVVFCMLFGTFFYSFFFDSTGFILTTPPRFETGFEFMGIFVDDLVILAGKEYA
jgi:hypothetical protein